MSKKGDSGVWCSVPKEEEKVKLFYRHCRLMLPGGQETEPDLWASEPRQEGEDES